MFETDYVDKAIRLLDLATVPPLTVNFAGTEDTTVEGYCQIVADLIGTTVEFEVTDRAWAPLRADVTKLRALVGSTAVTAADGFERMLKARHGEPDG
jgi:hypothetical protein